MCNYYMTIKNANLIVFPLDVCIDLKKLFNQ